MPSPEKNCDRVPLGRSRGGPAFAWREEGATTALMAAVGMGGPTGGFAVPDRLEREALTLEAVRLAVDLGVEVDAQNAAGRTAAQAAQGRGYDSVLEFLRRAGRDLGLRRSRF